MTVLVHKLLFQADVYCRTSSCFSVSTQTSGTILYSATRITRDYWASLPVYHPPGSLTLLRSDKIDSSIGMLTNILTQAFPPVHPTLQRHAEYLSTSRQLREVYGQYSRGSLSERLPHPRVANTPRSIYCILNRQWFLHRILGCVYGLFPSPATRFA